MSSWYTPSQPRAASGGIRSQSRTSGEKWWSKRWIAVLESLYLGGRLTRGRSYARQGQVLSLEIQPGGVVATVQGSRVRPYRVSIKLKPFSPQQWDSVRQALQDQILFLARLLAGELPAEVEALFHSQGMNLLPYSIHEINTHCTCPDDSNPCKHIAAVHYLLGEEFDRDPFLIFQLRGGCREMLLPAAALESEEVAVLPLRLEDYWNAPPLVAAAMGPLSPVPAPLVRQLGPFPMWRGEVRFVELMEPLCAAAARQSLERL